MNDDRIGFLQSTSIRRRFAIADFAVGEYERLSAQTKSVIVAGEKRRPKQNDFTATLTMMAQAMLTEGLFLLVAIAF